MSTENGDSKKAVQDTEKDKTDEDVNRIMVIDDEM